MQVNSSNTGRAELEGDDGGEEHVQHVTHHMTVWIICVYRDPLPSVEGIQRHESAVPVICITERSGKGPASRVAQGNSASLRSIQVFIHESFRKRQAAVKCEASVRIVSMHEFIPVMGSQRQLC